MRPPYNAAVCEDCDTCFNDTALIGSGCCGEGSLEGVWVFERVVLGNGRKIMRPKGTTKWFNDRIPDWSEFYHYGRERYEVPGWALEGW